MGCPASSVSRPPLSIEFTKVSVTAPGTIWKTVGFENPEVGPELLPLSICPSESCICAEDRPGWPH